MKIVPPPPPSVGSFVCWLFVPCVWSLPVTQSSYETHATQNSKETTVLVLGCGRRKSCSPVAPVFALSFGWSYRVFGRCEKHKAVKRCVQYKALKKRPYSCMRAREENRANPSRRVCVFVWLLVSWCLPLRVPQSFNKTRATQISQETTMRVPACGERKSPCPVASCLRFVLVGRTVCLVLACNTKLSRNACNTKL